MAKLLSILLQRSDPTFAWGFSVRGGVEEGTLLTIDHVQPGTLAAQYLAAGDTVLQIEKVDTRQLRQSQVQQYIIRPAKSLELLVLKGTTPPATAPIPPARKEHDLRARKQSFWDRTISEEKDFCQEGFTRLDGADSPFRTRQPTMTFGRRCQSEEKSSPRLDDTYNSVFSDSEEHHSKYSDSVFDSTRLHSVWSPAPSSGPSSGSYWARGDNSSRKYERQGDMTFWEMSEGAHENSVNSDVFKPFKSNQSDLSRGYGSLSSEYSTTPTSPGVSFNSGTSYMKKPSDFLGNHYRDTLGRVRLGSLPPTINADQTRVNRNVSSVSEFMKSTSISKKSYSSAEGKKSFETYEEMNKTKETEKSSKALGDGKDEIVEKTKLNKEYVVSNKEDVNGKPKETKKIINDFKTIERVVDGKQEFYNKTKEHTEEETNSSTPVNFYDNVQEEGSKLVNNDRWRRAVERDSASASVNCDDSARSFSPLQDNSPGRRWATSTPVPDEDLVYRHEEPLQESFFEVDIRSPIESQVTYSTKEEILRRQSSQLSGGGSPDPVSPQGESQTAPPCPPAPPPPPPPFGSAPPPPPPPGLLATIPSVRLSSEIPEKRRSTYEPPAAIQNAMMTKDKKPFTYTPGGLDLSEIRSPRMARRINRNMNAPDLAPTQPRPSPLSNQPLPPSAVAAMQPQIAIPVLPQGGAGMPSLHHVTPGGHTASTPTQPPPPPPQPKAQPMSPPVQTIPSPPTPQPPSPQRLINRQPSPPPNSVPKLQPQHRHTKSEPQSSPTPGSIYVPPIESHQQQQPRAQLGSLYIPPLSSPEPAKPQSPVSQLNKAPTPWMSRQSQQVPKEVPPWANRENVQSASPHPQPQAQQQAQQQQPRIIPIQFESKEPPQQQQKQPNFQQSPQQYQQNQPVTRIIPIQMEGTPSPQHTPQQPSFNQQQQHQQEQQQYQQQQYQQQQQQYQQQQQQQGRQTPRWMNQQPVYVHNKFNAGSPVQSPVPAEQNNGDNQQGWRHSQTNGTMQSPGPVQSRSFKVLEKITGTDNGGVDQPDAPYNSQGVPLSQLRKMQLSDDDRALMNKVKSQVDDEIYLHSESDPRYRGSAIPSRAFRILQSMTDGSSSDSDVPRAYSPAPPGQNRMTANQTPQPDMPQQYIPPSEQQAPEPRKYTGGAIPSRSFRMLQAMTAGPEASDRPGESEY